MEVYLYRSFVALAMEFRCLESEILNSGGSVKDRVAVEIIEEAKEILSSFDISLPIRNKTLDEVRNMANTDSKKTKEDFNLKVITPKIGAVSATSNNEIATDTELVESTLFLYVRIVSARDLPGIGGPNTCDPFAEVKVETFKGRTLCLIASSNPEWNQVFAFEKARIKESTVEIVVRDNIIRHDEILGKVSFDISDVSSKGPTDSALAPQWYGLFDQKGRRRRGELMLSVWIGTQADEAFPEALHLDAISINVYNIANTRAHIYLSPRIWCLRLNLIQAQDLLIEDGSSGIFIEATVGGFTLKSKFVGSNKGNPKWNEDLFIVVAEPLDQDLVLSVEQGTLRKHESLGKCTVPIKNVDKRVDSSPAASKWYDLERPKVLELEQDKRFSSKLNVRLSLDGGYHIFDEDPHSSSDLNATALKLWRPSIGVFEMGILNATGLPATKKGNRTDAFCVAKYGAKWVRTRTIINSLSPKWNEQYSWEVYDPCTFITIAVFDNGHLQELGEPEGSRDARMGKVRIRLSDLVTDRIYSYSYPLIELQSKGLKKMGEIHLSFRFCCSNMLNLLHIYPLPMLPTMHFSNPLTPAQFSGLRKQAVMLISLRMSKAEPPLSKEVVEYMLGSRESVWSMRRGRVEFDRINILFSDVVALCTQFDQICKWKNPITTLLIYLVLFVVILEPQFVLPAIFFYLILDVILQYPRRPRHPSHVDTQLSHVDKTSRDELEEEFDPVPSMFIDNNIRFRYDRLRIFVGKFVVQVGNFATIGEKLQSFVSWQDPTATLLFMILCLITGVMTFIIPFRVIVSFWFLYLLRHPRFRPALPPYHENWLRRMPSKLDRML